MSESNPIGKSSALEKKARPPIAIILGSPAQVRQLVFDLHARDIVCYQMDLFQAGRLEEELRQSGLEARVVTAPDLWDLPAEYQTVVYPVQQGGERLLKIDMIEQGFHVLRPRGTFIVLSPYEKEDLFPSALKKVFGRVHTPQAGEGQVFWCQREKDRPRRRHEVVYQVRFDHNTSLRFLSRPGVFSHGRMDDGARALVETMVINPGDKVVDVGCGCGTNGIIAALRSGSDGSVLLVDSNVRAVALAEHNARANGVANFQTVASSDLQGLAAGSFDVALANPPYYAQLSIARLFIERSHDMLRPGGRFYLVTRQADQVGPIVAEVFGEAEAVSRRGYLVFSARV